MKQSTVESCLACCLLEAVQRLKGVKATRKAERDCLYYALEFTRDDFVAGHCDYVARKYGISCRRIIENKRYHTYLKRIKQSNNTTIEVQNINLKTIDGLLPQKPIVLIDRYNLFKVFHYPHWITVHRKTRNVYEIYDVWDGKRKKIPAALLAKSISSLRNQVKMSPQMVIMRANTSPRKRNHI